MVAGALSLPIMANVARAPAAAPEAMKGFCAIWTSVRNLDLKESWQP